MLTNVYGVNYKKSLVTTPAQKVHQGEFGGKKLVMIDQITLDADAADGDTVKVGRLPAGAKVLSARLFGADLGGAGSLKLGNSASLDSSGDDTADDDSFITAADSSGQAYDVSDNASAAMRGAAIHLVRFVKEVDVLLKFNGVTAGATGAIIYTRVEYIVD